MCVCIIKKQFVCYKKHAKSYLRQTDNLFHENVNYIQLLFITLSRFNKYKTPTLE